MRFNGPRGREQNFSKPGPTKQQEFSLKVTGEKESGRPGFSPAGAYPKARQPFEKRGVSDGAEKTAACELSAITGLIKG